MTPTQDSEVSASCVDGLQRLTRLVRAMAYSPSPEVRAALADLCGAVALSDRLRTPGPLKPTGT